MNGVPDRHTARRARVAALRRRTLRSMQLHLRQRMRLATVAAALTITTAPLSAQVVLGTVTDSATNEPIAGALVSLQDSARRTLAEVRTQQDGRFLLDGQRAGRIRFAVRKLGAQPSYSGFYDVPAGVDTLQVDLSAPVAGVMIATVTVKADAIRENSNVDRLAFARRNNWQIVEPWRVAEARELSNSLEDLMRRVPLGGVRVPEMIGDCFSSKRAGNRSVGQKCMHFVVDEMILADPFLHINPMDVHFVAYVPAIKARILWGPLAANGVIYIATRKNGDIETRPERTPRR